MPKPAFSPFLDVGVDSIVRLLEATSDGTWDWDVRNDTVRWSGRLLELLRYESAAASFDDVESLVHPEDRERHRVAVERHLADGGPFRVDVRLRRGDGDWLWVHSRGQRLLDADGVPSRMVGFVIDAGEWYRFRDALTRTNLRFRSFMDHCPAAFYMKDEDGRHVFANRAAGEIVGMPAEEMIGKTTHECFSKEAADKLVALDAEVRAGKTVVQWSGEVVNADGGVSRIIDTKFPLPDIDADRTLLGGFGLDVTTLHEAEAARHRVERRLAAVVEAAPYGVLNLDDRGAILDANAEALRILGCDAESCRGRPLSRWVEDEEVRRALESPSPPAGTIHRRCHGRRTDGTAFDCDLALAAYEFEGNTEFSAIVQDVTESLRRQREMQAMEERVHAVQRLESLGLLAGGIAHDLNNLLVGIRGNAELIRVDDGRPDDHVDGILHAAERAASLCNQLLAYAGRSKVDLRPVDPAAFLRDCEELLRMSTGRSHVLRVELESSIPSIEIDPVQIRQVLLNLVINASEALAGRDDGRIEIVAGAGPIPQARSRQVFHSWADEDADRFVRFAVRDNGSGMDWQDLPRMFDPFFTTKEAGHGLGLAAVLGIVRQHRGAITVSSGPGSGSTVEVYLPVSGAAVADEPAPEPGGRLDLRGRHGLVVDDEPLVLRVATTLLRSLGAEVTGVATGEEALDLVRDDGSRYAFVLLDLTMPGISGQQTLALMRERQPELPVVLSSGFAATGRPEIDDARTAYLQKPYSLRQLEEALSSVLGARGR